MSMSDKEQKEIFAKNLCHYVELSGKQQKDIAIDLGFNQKTFNGWCNGLSLPTIRKIQMLADYFHIEKSDLVDNKPHDVDRIYRLSEDEACFIEALRSASPEAKSMLMYLSKFNDKNKS